ncbi:MAG: zinc ribbon domain regulatory protein CdsZ, partial [Parachlamydiaceae bacterium]
KTNLQKQLLIKDHEISELKVTQRLYEGEIGDIQTKIKKLEAQQNSVKKLDEFNALTHEMNSAEKERVAKELRMSDLIDHINAAEDAQKALNETLDNTCQNGKALESEIIESIQRINGEGSVLKEERDALVQDADKETFNVYERLLRNKKDRVVVPIEERCCSGCHITLTPQHENLVRKGERLVFCEHCSRIHYWPEGEALEESSSVATKTRRRRSSKV